MVVKYIARLSEKYPNSDFFGLKRNHLATLLGVADLIKIKTIKSYHPIFWQALIAEDVILKSIDDVYDKRRLDLVYMKNQFLHVGMIESVWK
jgi:hypothetical protein